VRREGRLEKWSVYILSPCRGLYSTQVLHYRGLVLYAEDVNKHFNFRKVGLLTYVSVHAHFLRLPEKQSIFLYCEESSVCPA